jgi:hypothetical protein
MSLEHLLTESAGLFMATGFVCYRVAYKTGVIKIHNGARSQFW